MHAHGQAIRWHVGTTRSIKRHSSSEVLDEHSRKNGRWCIIHTHSQSPHTFIFYSKIGTLQLIFFIIEDFDKPPFLTNRF